MRTINGLQTPYDDPAIDAPGAAGDFASTRGGRPAPSGPGGVGLVNSPMSSNVPTPGTSETDNSLSGLPKRVDGIDAGRGGGMDATFDVDISEQVTGRTIG